MYLTTCVILSQSPFCFVISDSLTTIIIQFQRMDGYTYQYTALNNIVGCLVPSSDGCSKSKVAAYRQTWKGGEIVTTTPLCNLESFHNVFTRQSADVGYYIHHIFNATWVCSCMGFSYLKLQLQAQGSVLQIFLLWPLSN